MSQETQSPTQRLVLDLPPTLEQKLNVWIEESASHHKKESDRQAWRLVLYTLGAIFVAAYAWFIISTARGAEHLPNSPHVVVLEISGVIGAEADGLRLHKKIKLMSRVFANPGTEGVIIQITSPGGNPAVAQRIGAHGRMLADRHKKPFIVHIDSMGASAAYLLALYADEIHASQFSLTGSTGAVIGALNWSELAEKIGVREESIASSDHKKILSPWSDISEAHEQEMQSLVDNIAEEFVDFVIERRGARLRVSKEELMIARLYRSTAALNNGMIDGIGTLEQVAENLFRLPTHRTEVRRNLYEQLVLMTVNATIDAAEARMRTPHSEMTL